MAVEQKGRQIIQFPLRQDMMIMINKCKLIPWNDNRHMWVKCEWLRTSMHDDEDDMIFGTSSHGQTWMKHSLRRYVTYQHISMQRGWNWVKLYCARIHRAKLVFTHERASTRPNRKTSTSSHEVEGDFIYFILPLISLSSTSANHFSTQLSSSSTSIHHPAKQ